MMGYLLRYTSFSKTIIEFYSSYYQNFYVIDGPDHLINIITQPTSQTVKLKKAEEIFTLHCQAKARDNEQLQYTWYYLKGGEKPENIDKAKKSSRGTGPSIDIAVNSAKVSGRKRRYFCDVSVVDQPLCHVASSKASSEAVITLEPGQSLYCFLLVLSIAGSHQLHKILYGFLNLQHNI